MKKNTDLYESRIIRGEFKAASNATDHTGLRYNRLTVLRCTGIYVITDKSGKQKKRRIWLCVCDCGEEIETIGNRLTSKLKNSCGCQKSEATREFNKTKRKEIGESVRLQQYQSSQTGSKKRNLEFSLSYEEFVSLSEDNCYYCNSKPSQTINLGHYSYWTRNGIDRVDNNQGYIYSNCVTACKYCNFMKHSLDMGDFIEKCKLIADRFKDFKHDGVYKSCKILDGLKRAPKKIQ